MKNRLVAFVVLFSFFACSTQEIERGVVAEKGMVVTAHPLASEVGAAILKQGGNAYDAAVAVQFALAVVYPRAGNLAGGGFLVSRDADGQVHSLDFREKAPKNATEKMYLDDLGNPIKNLSTQGYLAVGVPGSVAGMWELHQKKGKLEWKELVQPAINLAQNGFQLTKAEADKLNQYQKDFYETNSSSIPFLNDKGWKEGDQIQLPALAETLTQIKEKGRNGFYQGKVALQIATAMEQNDGIITLEDLANYQPKWRTPIQSEFKSYNVISMPPPSSGGIALAQLLKGVELRPELMGKHNSSETIHLYTELERRVYADRATHLGDADFYDVPQEKILSTPYLKARYATIKANEATKSSAIKEGKVNVIESIETTHFSIVDQAGNAVAITTTLNGNYGSKVFLNDVGIFLNNEMDDFSMKPGVPNMFGLVGSEANKIEPEKRMLSSMTPTILEKDNQLFMVVGTPGGSTIITSVFQTIMNVTEFDMTMQEAVNAKKTHHQWLPEKVLVEKGALTPSSKEKLEELGHTLEQVNAIGRLDCILVLPDGSYEGAADPRGDDSAVGVE